MSEHPDETAGRVAYHAIDLIPDKLAPEAWAALVDKIARALKLLPPLTVGQANVLGDLVSDGYELGEYCLYDLSPAALELPPGPSPSAPLWDYLAELFRQAETELPMPPNSYGIGLHGTDVWSCERLGQRFSKGEAVNLAVWLLAVADPKLEAFGPMFAKVGGF